MHRSVQNVNVAASNAQEAVALLRERGLAIVKPDAGTKSPTYTGWPTRSLEPSDFAESDLIGILGGPLSDCGRPGHSLVIIDLDELAAVERADEFLPCTAMVEGRPGKPDDHRYFLLPNASIPPWACSTASQAAPAAIAAAGHPGPFKKQFRHAKTGKCVIDFIGTGGQVVCPGGSSPRQWVGGEPGDPATVPFPELWEAICRQAVACGCKLDEANGNGHTDVDTTQLPFRAVATNGRSVEADALAYLAKIPGAISGEGGHKRLFWAARVVVYGFDLGVDRGLRLLLDNYNPRCEPRWTKKELLHKCKQADKVHCKKPRGWLLQENADQHDYRNPDEDEDPSESAAPGGGDHLELLTDRGNAQRLIRLHGQDLRYCAPWNKWIRWDRARWRIDESLDVLLRAKLVIRDLYTEASREAKDLAGKLAQATEETRADLEKQLRIVQALIAWAKKSEAAPRLNAMEQLAKSEPDTSILPGHLDANPWLFNCPNGTIDLRTGQRHEHRPLDYITKLCPTSYDPAATCPTWMNFLDRVTKQDQELIVFKQRLFGYALTGDVAEHVLPIFHGTGSNGKTTELGTILEVMGGDYAIRANPSLLMQGRDEHATELAQLFGVRLLMASETEESAKLKESLIKDLTGGERIRARRMREDYWEFPPSHKIVLQTNHKPKVTGTDDGIWRRLRLVPFEARFWKADEANIPPNTPPEMMADTKLPEKLRAEAPGILAWMVRGCLDWQRGGLTLPAKVKTATNEYRTSEDVIQTWIQECCCIGASYRNRGGELYTCYQTWCDEGGEKPLTSTMFGRRLSDCFAKENSNGVWYVGIALNPAHRPQTRESRRSGHQD